MNDEPTHNSNKTLRRGVFQVAMDRCDTCVFRVRYDKRTRDRLFADVQSNDSFVSCHKFSHEDEETGEMIDSNVCCAGQYAMEPYQNAAMRLAHMIGGVVYVDEDGAEIACPLPQGTKMARYTQRLKAGKA